MPEMPRPGERMTEREWCKANGIGWCDRHDREFTETPEGRQMCESCGWEAQDQQYGDTVFAEGRDPEGRW